MPGADDATVTERPGEVPGQEGETEEPEDGEDGVGC